MNNQIPDPFHVGDYEIELVRCSATIAETWPFMTTMLLAPGSAGVAVARRLADAGM